MASKEKTQVVLKSDEGTTNGILYYTAYTGNDRTKRAVMTWLGCWLLAVITVFIPIAHFVLVPAFLIAGPIVGLSRYRQTDSKEKVVGMCPKHNAETTINLEATDKLPKWAYCPECNQSLQLSESAFTEQQTTA